MLTNMGADVLHRDDDGMSVLEHAEQNDRRQVVALIKRAQLANQMRQRRKQKVRGASGTHSIRACLARYIVWPPPSKAKAT